jgi:hypothetical protein
MIRGALNMRTKSAIVIACGLAMLAVVQGRSSSNSHPPPTTGAPAGAGRQGRQGGGGGRGGRRDSIRQLHGFDKIFDGTTLKNWDGDPTFWRVENGAIVGESTAEKPVTENTFLIYRGSEPDNFELKLEFRMNSTNSGVQYRSRQLTVPWVSG